MTIKERIVFRVKAGEIDVTPDLGILKERWPELNESEIIRMALAFFARSGSAA